MEKNKELADLYIDVMKKTLTATLYDQNTWGAYHDRENKFFLKHLIKYLKKRSMLLINTKYFSESQMEDGMRWSLFGFTMVGLKRLDNVQMCVEDAINNNVQGDLVEAGVWKGGTTIFMRALLKAYDINDRKVWVADSFEGLPSPKDKNDGKDLSDVDFLKISVEQVKNNFAKFNLLDDQVEFLPGWFCDSLVNAPIDKIAVLRLDGDMYSSTMDTLKNLYHKVSSGGYVIVDDYYAWPSCHKAVTEFLEANSLTPEIKQIDWTGAYWKV